MENELVFGFEALDLWKKAREVQRAVFQLIKQFPPEEKFRLTDQLLRSSRSVCSLIAEGHGRYTFKDQLHYCIQARGSLSETMNHLLDASDCNYIAIEIVTGLRRQLKETERLLNGYIHYLRSRLPS